MTSVFVIGGVAVDIIGVSNDLERIDMSTPHGHFLCLNYGSKTRLKDMILTYGGSAMNVAVTLKCMGTKTTLMSAVGDDPFAGFLKEKLRQFSISPKYVLKKPGNTSLSIVLLQSGEKSLLVHHGAVDHLGPKDVPADIEKAGAVVMTSMVSAKNQKLFEHVTKITHKKNIPLIFAPSMTLLQCMGNPKKLLEYDFFMSIMNNEEAQCITGKRTIKSMLKALPGEVAVITKGPEGAYARQGKKMYHCSNLDVIRHNTTGAGDTFCAGFVHTYLKTKDVKESLRMGSVVAAMKLSSTHPEVTCFPPEVSKFLKKYEKKLTLTQL